MPDELPIQQLSVTGVPVQNLVELYEAAETMFPIFQAEMEEWIKQVTGKSPKQTNGDIQFRLPQGTNKLKGKQRASEKANNDYSQKVPGPPESWLCDIIRGSVVFGSNEQLLGFLKLIRKDDLIKIVKSKNRFRNPALSGYQDWNFQIQIKASNDGDDDTGTTTMKLICELQLHHRVIEEADRA